ncbi:hypothetical protein ACIQ1D_18395 [Lysinibacillus xylanilyticus]|uniref:hypothetical protein n=1 Tax=Lysinibacillus xylanilyticus TaxID=582475 RepID=UPI00381F2D86
MVVKKDEQLNEVEPTSGSDNGEITKSKLKVGIVMPIAEINGCSEQHWQEVKLIIQESVRAIKEYEVTAEMVSDSEEVSVIHKTIVNNLYSNDIVIVDVSCKNANVMFELGMRLAFDKILVLIKDDKTSFSFDTGNIQHLEYPRDLRYSKIEKFKEQLRDKVLKTYIAHKENPNKSPYLEDYGSLKPAEITEKTVSQSEYLESMFYDLRSDIRRLDNRIHKENKIKTTSITNERFLFDSFKEMKDFIIPIFLDYMNLVNYEKDNIDFEGLFHFVLRKIEASNYVCTEYVLRNVLNEIVDDWDGLPF